MNKKKINDINIEVLKLNKDRKINIHHDLFSNYCPLIYISSMKHSGKTNLIYNILKYMAVKGKTNIYLFSKTADQDETTQAYIKKLEKYKIKVSIFDNLEYNNNRQIGETYKNILEKIFDDIKSDNEFNSEKIKNNKYSYCRNIIIFDDFSELLKNKSLESLMKKHRHFLTSIIISSQSYFDILPSQRQQINYLILFKGFPIQKLKTIYEEKIRGLTFDHFLKIYYDVTNKPYTFLYINADNEKDLRENFNTLIEI